jgi:hypothetical protein
MIQRCHVFLRFHDSFVIDIAAFFLCEVNVNPSFAQQGTKTEGDAYIFMMPSAWFEALGPDSHPFGADKKSGLSFGLIDG